MKIHRTLALTAMMGVLVGLPLAADWPVTEKLDLDAIYRIKEEGLQRSNVRLTGSPNMKAADDWARAKLETWVR